MKAKIAGLWVKEGQNGTYLSGTIDSSRMTKEEDVQNFQLILAAIKEGKKVFVNIYANSYKKEGDNKPDWELYLNLPDGTGYEAKPKEATPTKAKANILQSKAKAAPASQSNNTYEDDGYVTEDDIPF